jgi:hypothetical protein
LSGGTADVDQFCNATSTFWRATRRVSKLNTFDGFAGANPFNGLGVSKLMS